MVTVKFIRDFKTFKSGEEHEIPERVAEELKRKGTIQVIDKTQYKDRAMRKMNVFELMEKKGLENAQK